MAIKGKVRLVPSYDADGQRCCPEIECTDLSSLQIIRDHLAKKGITSVQNGNRIEFNTSVTFESVVRPFEELTGFRLLN